MRSRSKRLNTSTSAKRWYCSGGIGLGLVAIVVVLIITLQPNDRMVARENIQANSVQNADISRSLNTVKPLVSVETLPTLNFQLSSVEEACGVNEFPAYWNYEDEDMFEFSFSTVLKENEECWNALERHGKTINPYLWNGDTLNNRSFAFVVLDNPLTFGRIFANPDGDLAKVREALARPECLLEHGTEVNWQLKNDCHAEALMNYALFNRYCYNDGLSYRRATRADQMYQTNNNPTLEQDRLLWKQELEDAWIQRKCEEFAPELKLTREQYPQLTSLLWKIGKPKTSLETGTMLYLLGEQTMLLNTIIELAARLGGDAAGLTSHFEKYGRYSGLLLSPSWMELQRKQKPSQDRLLQTFRMLAMLEQIQVEFDWKWLAKHLCTPPYHDFSDWVIEANPELENTTKFKSCRTVIDELYTRNDLEKFMLEKVDQFANIVLELEI